MLEYKVGTVFSPKHEYVRYCFHIGIFKSARAFHLFQKRNSKKFSAMSRQKTDHPNVFVNLLLGVVRSRIIIDF